MLRHELDPGGFSLQRITHSRLPLSHHSTLDNPLQRQHISSATWDIAA
jgi:hypothetical protein